LSRQKLRAGRGTSGLKQSQVFIRAIFDHFEFIRPELKKTMIDSVGRNKKNGSLLYEINREQSD